jgi:hypothetical protein
VTAVVSKPVLYGLLVTVPMGVQAPLPLDARSKRTEAIERPEVAGLVADAARVTVPWSGEPGSARLTVGASLTKLGVRTAELPVPPVESVTRARRSY